MPDALPEPAYVDSLATTLHHTYPGELQRAENELRQTRVLKAAAARFIQDPAYDLTARQTLAELLGLPGPHVP
jgi:hypothetical protein